MITDAGHLVFASNLLTDAGHLVQTVTDAGYFIYLAASSVSSLGAGTTLIPYVTLGKPL